MSDLRRSSGPRDVAISDVKAHPDQHLYDGTLADADEQALLEDLQTNGQRDPIKILSDGTVLDGHQRVRLLGQLGHDTVRAIVVDVYGDEHQQRAAFLRQNMSRRQLSPLQHARLALRLYEAENGLPVGEAANARRWLQVRRVLLSRLDGSARHVNRVLRVILLPDVVATAVELGRLKMTLAEKLDKLDEQELENVVSEITAALDSGENINAVAAAALPEPQSKLDLDRDLGRAFEAIETIEQNYGDDIDGLQHPRWRQHLERCAAAKAIIDRVFHRIEAIDPDLDPWADLMDTIGEAFDE